MTTTRTAQGIEVSQIVNGHRLHRHYIGYTTKEAKQLFSRFVKGYLHGLENIKAAEQYKRDHMTASELLTYTNSDR